MRVKIVSDGFANTKVVNAETGEPIEGVIAVTWKVDVKHVPEATLTLHVVAADVIGEVDES